MLDGGMEVDEVIAAMPEVSRALSKGDAAKAYWLLRDALPIGPAGFALLELIRTIPDWQERAVRRYPDQRRWGPRRTLPKRPRTEQRAPQDPSEFVERHPTADTLSEAEFAIIVLVAEGLTDVQIGEALGRSPMTVKHHLKHLYDRFGVANRPHLVGEAFRRGLIT